MDSKTNEILQKFSKQKIDLSKADEIIKAAQKTSQDFEKSVKEYANLLNSLDRAISYAEGLVKLAKNTMPDIERLDKSAKELGIKLDPKLNKAAQTVYEMAELAGPQHLKDMIKIKNIAK